MSEPVIQLNELELDALAELANIGVGRAAASLGKMVGSEILLSVPSVELISRHDAARILDEQASGGTIVAVYQEFAGTFSGCALLMFPEASSHELAHAVAGTHGRFQSIAEVEQEAIEETGNIVLSSCLGTIANILRRTLDISVPKFRRGDSRAVLWTAAHCRDVDLVLFLYINFKVSGRQVSGYLALTMDIDSLTELRMLIGDFIVQAQEG